MKQRYPTTGTVHEEILISQQDGDVVTIAVDSSAWFAWLQRATSFRFRDEEGHFTAHKTHAGNRRGGSYWRATRRRLGRLYSFYLGTDARLTLQRLREAARDLAVRAGAAAPPPAPPVLTPSPAGPLDESSDPLLATKLHLPRLPVQHVSRPRLLALLDQGVQRPLTLVSAPAGSGKTTLLAEWAATTTLPVTWLSLEAGENDPARFFSYLMAALAHLDEHIGTSARTSRSVPMHSWEQVMTNLLNDLVLWIHQDAVVILDDYHLITTETIHAILQFLLDHLPAHMHLVIGTRLDPPLPLSRLRARNQVSELRTEELCFVSSEVEAFAHVMGLTLSSEATSLLEERTEGWIAGVQLLALALRGQADAATFLRASGGNHRFLLDYLSEEVLEQQTPEMRRFLLRTSLLERITGPLCDVVTGEPGGQARLAALLRENLFVSALDDTETWYRYHPLFSEALRAHLSKQEPELIPELYRRASSWYEQQHWDEEACEYAFLAGDLSHAATLLEHLIPHLLEQGKFLQMRQWLSQLSPPLVAASPTLWVASISLQMLRTGIQGSEAQTMTLIIEQIEQQIQAHAQDGESAWAELQSGLPLMQAIAALTQGDIAGAISFAGDLSPALAGSESPLSHFIALGKQGLLGAAYGASGDLAAAEQLFFAVSPSGSTAADRPRNLSVAASLSDQYEAHGQLHRLGQFYDDLFQELAQRAAPSPPMLSALMQARYALLLYEWNQLAEAEKAAQQSIEMAERLDRTVPVVSVVTQLSLWTQARIALARSDSLKAGHLLKHIESNVTTLQIAVQGQRLLGAIPARLALACGQLEPALRWVETCRLRFDDTFSPTFRPANNDYLDYITLARVLLTQGRDPRHGSRLSQAAFLLERLRNLAVEKGWQGRLREIEMLTALTLQAQGKTKRALTILGAVLAQAESEGYVRLFVDEGPPMMHLLAQVSAYTTASSGYIQQLQAALAPMQHASIDPQRQPLPDPLSPREQEVLQLVARGFSNQQIADHLIISLNTAKRHVKHLLAKLVVTNRTQALARARELHLL